MATRPDFHLSRLFLVTTMNVTVYAFSIDNFKRQPDEVQCLMDLMVEKIEELLKTGSVLDRYGIRLYFIGNLKLLNENVQRAAETAMKATASNNKTGFDMRGLYFQRRNSACCPKIR